MAAERTTVPFIESLRASGLLTDDQLAELARCPEARDPAPTPLARVIFQRGWLTRFQLNMIAAGSAKGLTVGPYVVLDRIGEGGMGMIYKARHQHMQRIVALKVIRKEKLASPDAVSRFYREVQMAGTLHHPNIVLAYDAGQAGNTHYFAMEYIDGVDLSHLVKEKGPLPVAQACDYIRQIAVALQHAHEKGLVHRDVKPSNMLLSRGPKGDVVKLLDMGLARSQSGGDTGLTKIGAVIGTPDYLAPEQAMNSKAADIRADLYSLGCSLFYLLSGRPPFTANELTEVLLKHQMEKPTPLAQLGVDVPKKVQAILDRLMAKQPDQRYQTPAELIEDLEPFSGTTSDAGSIKPRKNQPADDWSTVALDNDQEEESPGRSATVRLNRRRPATDQAQHKKRLLLIGIGGGAALLVLGVVLFLLLRNDKPNPVVQGPKSSEPTERSDTGKEKSSTNKGGNPDGGKPIQPVDDGNKPPLGKVPPPEAAPGMLGTPRNEHVRAIAFSPDGKRAVTVGGPMRLWDMESRKQLHDFGGVTFRDPAVVWSADGRRVLVGGWNELDNKRFGVLTLFDADSGAVVKRFDVQGEEAQPQGVHAVAISPDGKHILSAARSDTCGWDVETGKRVLHYKGPRHGVEALAYASNGTMVVGVCTARDEQRAWVWPVDQEQGLASPVLDNIRFFPVISPDGNEVATAFGNGWVIYDVMTGRERSRSEPLPRDIWSLVWSSDGKYLVCGTPKPPGAANDPSIIPVYLTNAYTGKLLKTYEGHNRAIQPVAVSRDGRFMISSGSDGARLWTYDKSAPDNPPNVASGTPLALKPREGVTAAAFSPDGKRVVIGAGKLRLWDIATNKEVHNFNGATYAMVEAVVWSADGKRVLVGGAVFRDGKTQGEATLYEVDSGKVVQTFKGHPSSIHAVALSADGQRVLTAAGAPRFKDGKPEKGPDGKLLYNDTGIRLWDAAKGTELGQYFGPAAPVHSLVFAADGKSFFAAGAPDDAAVFTWEVESKNMRRANLTASPIDYARLSPDGQTVVYTGSDFILHFANVKDGFETRRSAQFPAAAHSRRVVARWPIDRLWFGVKGRRRGEGLRHPDERRRRQGGADLHGPREYHHDVGHFRRWPADPHFRDRWHAPVGVVR